MKTISKLALLAVLVVSAAAPIAWSAEEGVAQDQDHTAQKADRSTASVSDTHQDDAAQSDAKSDETPQRVNVHSEYQSRDARVH